MKIKATRMTGLAAAAVVAAASAVAVMVGTAPVTAATTVGSNSFTVSTVAVVAESAPATATGIDPVAQRTTTTAAAPAPAQKGQLSGANNGGAKCIVKWWEPTVLRSLNGRPVAFQQSKLVCNDIAGTSEILIEQNDQLVVAGTVVNNQTNVTLHSLTLAPNGEQWDDAFCSAIARQQSDGGAFGVVAQECAPLSNFAGHGYSKRR